MPARALTETYSVSPQLAPEDFTALKSAGFTTVICNRPDEENPADLAADVMAQAAQSAGLQFHVLPFNQMTLTLSVIAKHRALVDAADGPVLAYCASGNRSTVVWSLGEAQFGDMALDEIVARATEAGYDLRGVMHNLESLRAGQSSGD